MSLRSVFATPLSDRRFILLANAALALTTLAVAWCLLMVAPSADYGTFALLLVIQAFGVSVQQALLAAPLLILLNQPQAAPPAALLPFATVAVLLSLLLGLSQALVLWHFDYAFSIMLLFGLSGALQSWRWFGRILLQHQHPRRVAWSDLVFCLPLLLPVLALYGFELLDLTLLGGLLCLASVAGLWPLVAASQAMLQSGVADWSRFWQGYQKQGKPALLGVFTLELTANAHSYLIAFYAGPQAFAPVAAAALLFRPVSVVLASLAQSERPAMAKAWSLAQKERVWQLMQRLNRLALQSWALNLVLIALLLWVAPLLLWPESVGRSDFELAVVFTALLMLFRSRRSAQTAILQAADRFADMARITIYSAAFTLPLVVLTLWLWGPVYTLAALVAGEMFIYGLVARLMQRLAFAPDRDDAGAAP